MTQAPIEYPRTFDGPTPSVADRPDVKVGMAAKLIRIQGDWPAEPPAETLRSTALSFPPKFLLGHLRDSRLRVIEPFMATWTVEGGSVIMDAPEINEYGEGDTIEEAIKDLQASISELFFELDEERDRLGADLHRVYETLTRKLRRVDAANGE